MTISFKKIASRLTGFSTPIFGLSWNPPSDEREVIRKLILFLEDRRVLYYPYGSEVPIYVIDSILDIRKKLTIILGDLDEDSKAIPHIRAMRAASRKFLDNFDENNFESYRLLVINLGELRGAFGDHIAPLCAMYGIDITGGLIEILPIEDKE